MTDKTQNEQNESSLPPTADIGAHNVFRGFGPRETCMWRIAPILCQVLGFGGGVRVCLSSKARDQGTNVLATRKPSVSNRTSTWRLKRAAARTNSLSLRQEPPRTIRKLGSPPASHADPSVGAPS